MGRYLAIKIWLVYTELLSLLAQTENAIMAPPWADPALNPCAVQPRGWQLLYWPPDGKCYKIFQMGYPCSEDMELTPVTSKNGNLSAECRCPPKFSQSPSTNKCYELFNLGPCEIGYYFAPDPSLVPKRQWGTCKQLKMCPDHSHVFWPKDGKCYRILSRGPCSKGQLLFVDSNTAIPICTCGDKNELQAYKHENGHCYQHYTKGPCWENGHLFLPDKTCGCHKNLPHYHNETKQCYELDTRGPCDRGQLFQLDPASTHAKCLCKPDYIPYQNSSACYRPFTQGPCPKNYILIDQWTCSKQPCERGYLYHPPDDTCYRIGARGPCLGGEIFTFNFDTKPSIDGISYNGKCMCERKDCSTEFGDAIYCDKSKGLIKYKGGCHKMYTQGPCFRGSWLVPKREGKEENYYDGSVRERSGTCECIPGYAKSFKVVQEKNVTVCLSPAMVAADFASRNFSMEIR